ncbi:hypothetical protein [Microbacterium sp. Yaish 1]|uniref:hypothetical protein n=1 Tax=Microbacterium sp. Yaish 1 TaxID=2025014 RepID=UPI000B93C7AF|nr:hypothetical protein [Microbacterium sp. Yaish 1]OYC98389.1 hypothetical protein CI089_07945 [Microbacterium sp. Yaish 1]
MFRKTRSERERELDDVLRAIADHPLSSEEVRQANSLIEQLDGEDPSVVNDSLASRGLPSLDALGKMQLKHGLAFGRLHRRRYKLEKKLGRT